MICSQCGSNNKDEAQSCKGCGSELTKQTPPEKKNAHDPNDDVDSSINQDISTAVFSKVSRLADRYDMLDWGKRGGMGMVFKVRDKDSGKVKALKIIHSHLTSNEKALSRFKQEISISQDLIHDNIVRVYDLVEVEGGRYFTMEWVEGVTLRDVIEERKKENKPFTLEEAHTIISQLSDALSYAHEYTIHRNIKPENILIEAESGQRLLISEGIKIKLTDFGIAKMLSPSQFTSTSTQMGTPHYMAPEQKADAAIVDKRSDIYALGVVLFELLTLNNTIGSMLPSQINQQLPKSIDSVVMKALDTEPDGRYGNARDVSEALRRVLMVSDGSRDEAKKDIAGGVRRRNKGNPAVLMVSLIILIAIAAAGYLYISGSNVAREEKTLKQNPYVTKEDTTVKEENKESSTRHAPLEHEEKNRIASLLGRADEQMNAKNYTSPKGNNAFSTLKQILYIDPENAQANDKIEKIRDSYMALGNEGFNTKEYDKALEHYKKALFVSPGYEGAKDRLKETEKRINTAKDFIRKGKDLENRDRHEEALKQYEEAKEEYPGIEGIGGLIAKLEQKIAGEKTSERNKVKAKELIRKGQTDEKKGYYNEALKKYKEAKRLYPEGSDSDNLISRVERIVAEKERKKDAKRLAGEMVFVKGGCYQMGDTFGVGYDDEKPVHEVCVDDFYMGKYEVTQKQWRESMGNTPSQFSGCDDCPVEKVSWNDVQHYIKKLNQKSGGYYRLPTEAEWEYACRSGGKKEKYAGSSSSDSVAWYDSNSGNKIHPVGKKSPNGLGIYDMSGNVREWVQDWHDGKYYSNSPWVNPAGANSGSDRVLRGSSWNFGEGFARCSFRNSGRPDDRHVGIGFRLIRTSK